jgi:hypothetical protein
VRTLRRAGLRISLGVVVGLAVTASAALAGSGGMSPKLGARLAGMGEHGIVNLEVSAKKGKLCWSFDLPTTTGITGASIHTGKKGPVLLKLGMKYSKKGCTKASEMTLAHLEDTPGAYWVFVDTKGHPGDLRGKLFAGMANM